MDNLTNIIEAVLFASGNSVSISLLAEKLEVSVREVNKSIDELKEKYSGDCGIYILIFNNKIQLATNPGYRDPVALVLNSIKEKEFTKTILECAAIIAYKQPITRGELDELRGVNSDYAVRTLLDIGMIAPCGRKDVIGHPMLYGTTDAFLKRFNINALDDLPDYEALLSRITELNDLTANAVEDSYLYSKDEYIATAEEDGGRIELPEDEGELPDFLKEDEN